MPLQATNQIIGAKMLIDIYTSAKNSGKHISVPAGTNPSTIKYPEDLDKDLRTLSPKSRTVDIKSGEKRIGIDADDIIDQINDKGYAVHGTTITTTISTGTP